MVRDDNRAFEEASMSTPLSDLETRVRHLEQTVQSLTKMLPGQPHEILKQPWWERIAGSFQGSDEYAEAMSLATSFRRSQASEADQT